jgi:hypothetical protein
VTKIRPARTPHWAIWADRSIGTTGVWVALELQASHSQTPHAFYNPTFIASV